MLAVTGLRVERGGAVVVGGVSLRIGEGESVALVGANGAGKSSVGKAIAGLIPALEGSVDLTLDGKTQHLGRLPSWMIHRHGLHYVPAERPVFEVLTVKENLRVPGAVLGAAKWQSHLDDVLDLFPVLAGKLHQAAGTLSGGEKRILAIACACLGAALRTNNRESASRLALLILDEPTHGLSPLAIATVTSAIHALRARLGSLLIIEQNVAFAAKVSESGSLMVAGQIVWTGPMTRFDEEAGTPQPEELACQSRN